MRVSAPKSLLELLLSVVAGLTLIVCTLGAAMLAPAAAAEKFDCVTENSLEKMFVPEAALEEFSCSFEKYEGADTLHFHVTVKNISSQPQRFRVNIFLDNGKAVGGLIPRTTKEGLIEPGKTGSFVYPVMQMAEKPQAVTVKVSTVSP